MSIHGYFDKQGEARVVPCPTERDSWSCPNMKDRDGDADMRYEHYDCKVCGQHIALDYEEMK